MHIKIMSRLSRRARRTLHVAAQANWDRGPASETAFAKSATRRSEYFPMIDEMCLHGEYPAGCEAVSHAHRVARHMMCVAGETFRYAITE